LRVKPSLAIVLLNVAVYEVIVVPEMVRGGLLHSTIRNGLIETGGHYFLVAYEPTVFCFEDSQHQIFPVDNPTQVALLIFL